jgi:hypothetical protein
VAVKACRNLRVVPKHRIQRIAHSTPTLTPTGRHVTVPSEQYFKPRSRKTAYSSRIDGRDDKQRTLGIISDKEEVPGSSPSRPTRETVLRTRNGRDRQLYARSALPGWDEVVDRGRYVESARSRYTIVDVATDWFLSQSFSEPSSIHYRSSRGAFLPSGPRPMLERPRMVVDANSDSLGVHRVLWVPCSSI